MFTSTKDIQDKENPRKSLGLWVYAYFLGIELPPSDLLNSIVEQADAIFSISKTRSVYGSKGFESPKPIKGDRLSSFAQMVEYSCRESKSSTIGQHVYMAGMLNKELRYWYVLAENSHQFIPMDRDSVSKFDPRLGFGISLDPSVDDYTLLSYALDVTQKLLACDRLWYGFINVAPDFHVSNPYQYSLRTTSGPWERIVETTAWCEYLLDSRQQARGLFWGNLFGKDMAERLRAVGLLDLLRSNAEFHSDTRCVQIEGLNGSLGVLLDDKPIRFGQLRDQSMSSNWDAAVRNGAALRASMIRAGI